MPNPYDLTDEQIHLLQTLVDCNGCMAVTRDRINKDRKAGERITDIKWIDTMSGIAKRLGVIYGVEAAFKLLREGVLKL